MIQAALVPLYNNPDVISLKLQGGLYKKPTLVMIHPPPHVPIVKAPILHYIIEPV